MKLQGETTASAFERSKRVIPHGVNSNFRYWGEEDTLVIKRGEGAYVWDMDDKRYIDYRLGFGPVILGHAYPPVVERVKEVLQDGNLFAWTTPYEISVAERITRMCKVDKVRLTNTGTEATMHALRIARAYTGREKFIKFEGQYHGMADYFMFSTASSERGGLGSIRNPIAMPNTSGIPKALNQYVLVVAFNDFEGLERTVKANWGDLAAIFIEPMLGNSASIMPKPGFLEKIRELCDEYGIVMMFDEVKTGFRVARGGAQELLRYSSRSCDLCKSDGQWFPDRSHRRQGRGDDDRGTRQPGTRRHLFRQRGRRSRR